MDYLYKYLIENFVLLCCVIVLSITLLRKIKTQKRIGIYLLIIMSLTLLISVLEILKDYTEYEIKSVFPTTLLSAILYVLRPLCILCFIFLSGQKFKGVWFYILLVPISLNIIVNIFPFIGATRTWAFYYEYSTVGEKPHWEWVEGNFAIFRFMPHIVSIIYLVFLLYKSIRLLQHKHVFDAIGVIICAAVVSLATVIETFFDTTEHIRLLPTSIAISTVFYYMFLYERNNKMDVLTGLFNRATYFDDFNKFSREITGVIQLDMNGLKYLNDNYGHIEGDKGLQRIAQAILNNFTRKMYAYRLGGDEFVILAVNETKDKIMKFISAFKEELSNTKYHCSLGFAYKDEESDTIEKMFKLSEQRMYQDKADFYKTSNIERRKSHYTPTK